MAIRHNTEIYNVYHNGARYICANDILLEPTPTLALLNTKVQTLSPVTLSLVSGTNYTVTFPKFSQAYADFAVANHLAIFYIKNRGKIGDRMWFKSKLNSGKSYYRNLVHPQSTKFGSCWNTDNDGASSTSRYVTSAELQNGQLSWSFTPKGRCRAWNRKGISFLQYSVCFGYLINPGIGSNIWLRTADNFLTKNNN